ncbi:MAG: penicillin-binding transpeptidase domain-containing protein, partial [Oscillospiraceae bacterium]|nr:penicillin-binding transpeptidase domain-containing protein [Oscillospiraceae bacterium]
MSKDSYQTKQLSVRERIGSHRLAKANNGRARAKADLAVKRRLLFMLTLFLCAFSTIALRIAHIQFIEGDSLSEQASINQSRGVDISPRRGAILDRNGDELAVNTVVETISIVPETLRKSISQSKGLNLDIVSDDLAYLLAIDSDFIYEKINKDSKYEVLMRKAEPEIAETIREYISAHSLRGLDLTIDSKRFYRNNNLASHVIGFTTEDNQGLTGIEASMEKYIKGTPGMIKGELDARRAEVPLSAENRIAVQDGLNVVLTIDTAIQLFATSALEKAILDNDVNRGGVIVVMDPRNGDILAMVSKPDFDLNDPYAPPLGYIEETWNGRSQAGTDILNRTVWRNKAIMDTYEPGSTFKPFTVAAGLEEGVISMESQFRCEPITGYYDNPIGCWVLGSHGTLDLMHCVMQSCNPALMRISQRVTRDRFYEYIRDFGFYERTGVPLPGEGEGIFQQNPRDVDMLVASFGQRFTITPLELITAYSAIANGGGLLKNTLRSE